MQQNFKAASSQEGTSSHLTFLCKAMSVPFVCPQTAPETGHCIRNGVHCRAISLSVDILRVTKTLKKSVSAYVSFSFLCGDYRNAERCVGLLSSPSPPLRIGDGRTVGSEGGWLVSFIHKNIITITHC